MSDSMKTTALASAEDVAVIPTDLRLALICWWRAHHHGGQQEERDAEELLCDAIGPRIAALRTIEFGGPS